MVQQAIATNISEQGLIQKLFKADVTKYSEEAILKELASIDARKVELLKLLEYGVDAAKYYLTSDMLSTLKHKFPFFHSDSIGTAGSSLGYTFSGVSMDVESHRLRTHNGSGTLYYTLPVYSYHITQGDSSLQISNISKKIFDVDRAWKNSINTSITGTNKFLSASNVHRAQTVKEIHSVTSRSPYVFTFNIRTGSKGVYKHPHSSAHTSLFNASICTGSENRFIQLSTGTDKIQDVYIYQVFLDGMLFWLQSINLSDCYGTFMAPERAVLHPTHASVDSQNEYGDNLSILDDFASTQHLAINNLLSKLYSETEWTRTWNNVVFGGKNNSVIQSINDAKYFVSCYPLNNQQWSRESRVAANEKAKELVNNKQFVNLVTKAEEALSTFYNTIVSNLSDDMVTTMVKLGFIKLESNHNHEPNPTSYTNPVYYNMPILAVLNTLDKIGCGLNRFEGVNNSFMKNVTKFNSDTEEEYNAHVGNRLYTEIINLTAKLALMEAYRHVLNTYLIYRMCHLGLLSSEVSREHLIKNVVIEDILHFTQFNVNKDLFGSESLIAGTLNPSNGTANKTHEYLLNYVAQYPLRLTAAKKFYSVNCQAIDRTPRRESKNIIKSFNFS